MLWEARVGLCFPQHRWMSLLRPLFPPLPLPHVLPPFPEPADTCTIDSLTLARALTRPCSLLIASAVGFKSGGTAIITLTCPSKSVRSVCTRSIGGGRRMRKGEERRGRRDQEAKRVVAQVHSTPQLRIKRGGCGPPRLGVATFSHAVTACGQGFVDDHGLKPLAKRLAAARLHASATCSTHHGCELMSSLVTKLHSLCQRVDLARTRSLVQGRALAACQARGVRCQLMVFVSTMIRISI